jgi:hypothetical protein
MLMMMMHWIVSHAAGSFSHRRDIRKLIKSELHALASCLMTTRNENELKSKSESEADAKGYRDGPGQQSAMQVRETWKEHNSGSSATIDHNNGKLLNQIRTHQLTSSIPQVFFLSRFLTASFLRRSLRHLKGFDM